MSVRGIWIAFAIGVTAGASVALLYAPQTGARTRRKLRNQLGNAGEYLEDASGYIKQRAERLSSDAQTVVELGKKRAGAAVDSASDLASSVAKSARSLV